MTRGGAKPDRAIRTRGRSLARATALITLTPLVTALSAISPAAAVTDTGSGIRYDYSASSQSYVVPSYVTSLNVTVVGGAGGAGGTDGMGYPGSAASGGYVSGAVTVTSGATLGVYVGSGGSAGASSAASSGGGAGGSNPLGSYRGGTGGNALPSGTSGAGGGGGAASVLTVGAATIVAYGGGGGGGANNCSGVYARNASGGSSGSTNGGGGQTQGSGDGGGGGGGGGGANGGIGGTTEINNPCSSEYTAQNGSNGANSAGGLGGMSSGNSGNAASANGYILIQAVAPAPTGVTASPSATSRTSGQTITFTASTTNPVGVTYQWLKNGNTIAGATSSTYTTAALAVSDSGTVFSVRATNHIDNTTANATSSGVTIQVVTAPSISAPDTFTSVTWNTAFTPVTIVGTVYAGSAAWSASGLPTGMSIGAATGIVSGTPTQAGAFSPVITLTDGNGVTAQRSYSLVVIVPKPTLSSANASSYARFAGQALTLSVTPSTTPTVSTYHYQWQRDGVNVGTDSASLSLTPSVSDSGTYTVTVYASVGGTNSLSTTLTVTSLVVTGAPPFHFDFNAGSFTSGVDVSDLSGWGNAGILSNIGVLGTGTNGVAQFLHFDGTRQLTTAIAGGGPQPFSIETWVRADAAAQGVIVEYAELQTSIAAQAYDRMLWIGSDGYLRFGVWPGTTVTIASNATIRDGEWRHVVITFDGSAMKMYINGVLQTDVKSSGGAYAFADGYWRVGGYYGIGWPSAANGYLDGTDLGLVRVYPVVLTAGATMTAFTGAANTYAPRDVSATLSAAGTTLTIAMSETLTSSSAGVISPNLFSISDSGTAVTPTSVVTSGKTVTLSLPSALVDGHVVSVTYTDPNSASDDAAVVQSLAGLDVPTFTRAVMRAQDPTFSPTAPTQRSVGGYTYTPSFANGVGTLQLGVSGSACTIADGVVSFVASGTCTVTGVFAGDATHLTASVSTSITVVAAPAITKLSLPDATWKTAYLETLTVTSNATGSLVRTWTGALPTGVTFDTSTGSARLIGTPTSSGAFAGTFRVVDANGAASEQSYSFRITAPAVQLQSTSPATLVRTAGQSATFTVTATTSPDITSAGSYHYAWKRNGVDVGTDTATLTINPLAQSDSGTYTVQVTATITDGGETSTASRTITALTVYAAPSISTASLAHGTYGSAYESQLLGAAGGSSTWTVETGTLPGGLSLSTAGLLSGTASVAETRTVTVQLTDANGAFTTRQLTLVVDRAALALAVGSPTITYGDATPSMAISVTGLIGSDTLTTALSIAGTNFNGSNAPTAAGTYALTTSVAAWGIGTSASSYALTAGTGLLTIEKATPVLAFVPSITSITKTFLDAPFALPLPHTTSDATPVYVIVSSDTSVVTLSQETATILAAGTTTITFTQPATANWNSESITLTVVVNKAAQSALLVHATNVHFGETQTLTYSGGSGDGAITYSVVSGPCALVVDVLSPTGVGNCVVRVARAESANYLAAVSDTHTVVIAKRIPLLTWWSNDLLGYGDTITAGMLDASVDVPGSLTYTSDGNLLAVGDLLTAGSHVLRVVFTPDDTANIETATTTATLEIDQRSLQVADIRAENKVLDHTLDAQLNLARATLVGVVPGDDVQIDTSHAYGLFNDPVVGLDKVVTIYGLTLVGADAANYVLETPTVTATIYKPQVVIVYPPIDPNAVQISPGGVFTPPLGSSITVVDVVTGASFVAAGAVSLASLPGGRAFTFSLIDSNGNLVKVLHVNTPPAAPELQLPMADPVLPGISVLPWIHTGSAAQYTLTLLRANASPLIITESERATSVRLIPGATYRATVQAIGFDGQTSTSAPLTFVAPGFAGGVNWPLTNTQRAALRVRLASDGLVITAPAGMLGNLRVRVASTAMAAGTPVTCAAVPCRVATSAGALQFLKLSAIGADGIQRRTIVAIGLRARGPLTTADLETFLRAIAGRGGTVSASKANLADLQALGWTGRVQASATGAGLVWVP